MDRIAKLAQIITSEYDNERVVVCCVLKGGHQFFSDLVHYMKKALNRQGKTLPMTLEFIRVKSYENDKSSGSVHISMSDKELRELEGKNLLLVEDIIDTGNTMKKLLERLQQYNIKSVKVASLLLKKTPLSCGYVPDYVGFAVPDLFVVGYCLDYNDIFRDLDHICAISETGKLKYAI
ncbi:hypoxanthine phosphoribosyltransferase 1 [Coemansia brasiliensis]|uniref:Hypoxanthine phosphoribosyltransferase n=1 Tax=Coemansia brasiliensis TaxID=2650707 RepID=A0A9W8I3J2_9FUNG|nr:hypoxanthine phosphoribosyltransferase 1 [Coemansia brasiliensis]